MSVILLIHFQQVHTFFFFEVIFVFKFFSLSSKFVFSTESAMSFLPVKFACTNLAAKFSPLNFLNFVLVLWLLYQVFLFLTSFTLASRVLLVAKLVISDNLFAISLILALYNLF